MFPYPYGFDDTHVERQRIFKEMHETDPTNVSRLLELAKEFDGLEYYQQALWKFSLDPLFHYWFAVPHCSCNKTVGETYYGRESMRAIKVTCPVHAQLLGGTRMIVGLQQMVNKDDRCWSNLIKFEKFV